MSKDRDLNIVYASKRYYSDDKARDQFSTGPINWVSDLRPDLGRTVECKVWGSVEEWGSVGQDSGMQGVCVCFARTYQPGNVDSQEILKLTREERFRFTPLHQSSLPHLYMSNQLLLHPLIACAIEGPPWSRNLPLL